jgi:hypothetical protein
MVAVKDLFNRLGSGSLWHEGGFPDLSADLRASYVANTTVAGLEGADVVLLVGTNPRVEAPVYNARLRKAFLDGTRFGVVGEAVDLTYPYEYLGPDGDALAGVKRGTPFFDALKGAKRPVVIVGPGVLNRSAVWAREGGMLSRGGEGREDGGAAGVAGSCKPGAARHSRSPCGPTHAAAALVRAADVRVPSLRLRQHPSPPLSLRAPPPHRPPRPARPDRDALLSSIHELVQQAGVVREDWNGLNILHDCASRVAALDIGFAPSAAARAPGAPPARFVYLLGADDYAEDAVPEGAFVVYQGHHGDRGAARADVVLPGAAYTEKAATYVNVEGRAQRTKAAVPVLGDAREDWRIVRAVSEALGKPLPYDSVDALRARMAELAPHLAAPNTVQPPVWLDGFYQRSAAEPAGKPAPGPLRSSVDNFFMTDAIRWGWGQGVRLGARASGWVRAEASCLRRSRRLALHGAKRWCGHDGPAALPLTSPSPRPHLLPCSPSLQPGEPDHGEVRAGAPDNELLKEAGGQRRVAQRHRAAATSPPTPPKADWWSAGRCVSRFPVRRRALGVCSWPCRCNPTVLPLYAFSCNPVSFLCDSPTYLSLPSPGPRSSPPYLPLARAPSPGGGGPGPWLQPPFLPRSPLPSHHQPLPPMAAATQLSCWCNALSSAHSVWPAWRVSAYSLRSLSGPMLVHITPMWAGRARGLTPAPAPAQSLPADQPCPPRQLRCAPARL